MCLFLSLIELSHMFSPSPGRANGLLSGKPVAVTSNRGAGLVSRRPGANCQLEQQYYQWKQSHPKPGEEVTCV